MKKLVAGAIIALVCIVVSGFFVKAKFSHAARLYLYGYPMVMMDHTRAIMINSSLDGRDRVNRLIHSQSFPDHNFRKVVLPNVDTLYSIAWLDLDEQPMVLSVPPISDRFYVMPLMDMWTNVYASVGTLTHGQQAVELMIAGPNWQGQVPDGLEFVRSPTKSNWLIGRIEAAAGDDIDTVARIQSQLKLATLSQWQQGHIQSAINADTNASRHESVAEIARMSTEQYLTRLVSLLEREGYPSEELELVQQIRALKSGIEQSWFSRKMTSLAFDLLKSRLMQSLEARKANENGWLVQRDGIGRYGSDYAFRTAVAIIGLGALPPEQAVYPNTVLDSQGQPLHGDNKYKIVFPHEQLPPVDGFWSLSVYDQQGFFIANEINRYAVSDKHTLLFEADGSLEILIQAEKPVKENINWLPAPKKGFRLVMRLYLPREEFLNGDWRLPIVQTISK